MSTSSGDGNRRRKQSQDNDSGGGWMTAAAVGVAAVGVGYIASKIAGSMKVPMANANGVENRAFVGAAAVDAIDSDVFMSEAFPAYQACQCGLCNECKYLKMLKNYDPVIRAGCSRVEFLKQVVEHLCHDVVDGKDEKETSSLILAIRTRDYSVVQAVMAFWPTVFKRGFDSDYDAVTIELVSGDYSHLINYIWQMVTDPFTVIGNESNLVATIPKELIFKNEPVPIAREGCPQTKGVRILSVDGGGTRGLVLLELLAHLEKMSKKTIAESFDWMGGTSTGGIIILFLASTNCRVEDCRKLYFRLKDEVFCGKKPYDALKFEKLLKEYFPPEKLMKDIERVKVVIPTVTGTVHNLEMQIFTNHDSSRDTPIWEVARMTSAAPSFFNPYEFPKGSKKLYYDGGLMANNPTQDICTALKIYDSLESATVVSLGTGKYCSGEQLVVNIDDSPLGIIRTAWSGNLKKLVDLLTNQVSKTDGEKIMNMMTLATTAKCFYVRLTPTLSQKLELDETDNGKLVNAVWHTKVYAQVNKDIFQEIISRL